MWLFRIKSFSICICYTLAYVSNISVCRPRVWCWCFDWVERGRGTMPFWICEFLGSLDIVTSNNIFLKIIRRFPPATPRHYARRCPIRIAPKARVGKLRGNGKRSVWKCSLFFLSMPFSFTYSLLISVLTTKMGVLPGLLFFENV